MALEAEPNVREISAEEKVAIANYRPPKVRRGQQVVFYPRGVRNKGDEALGWVWNNSNRRNLEIYVPHATGGTNVHTGVFFVEDPRLQLSDDVRSNGAWDFSEEYKAQQEWKDEIEKRLRAVEIATIFKSGHDRDVLFNVAKRLGLTVQRKLKSDTIRELIFESIQGQLEQMSEAAEVIEDEVSDPAPGEFDTKKVTESLDY